MYTTNAIESLNNSYKRLNKGRRVFPTIQSLEKSIYLSTKIITEKWTSRYQNEGVTLAELHTFFQIEWVLINGSYYHLNIKTKYVQKCKLTYCVN